MNTTGLNPQRVSTSRPNAARVRGIASILAVSALALGLTACGRNEEPTVGQRLRFCCRKDRASRGRREGENRGCHGQGRCPHGPKR